MGLRLSNDMHADAEREARRLGLTMSDFIRRAIRYWLKQPHHERVS